ncbi:MAG: acetyl-CoA carboxylase carboxyltransferase subunit alpha [Lachnospiraceae bacterium]|nr:acetyl-CoA carboxylase carboxyltransferase subunit alpha [Lachnospiraceae bacterium]
MTEYEKILLTREKTRPTARDYILNLITDFTELHGDRRYGDDPALIGGIGFLDDMPVTVIGIEKGHDTGEKISRNFGAVHPEGYRKALRLMRQAEKFHRPVLTIVDTAGAYCGIGAEKRGQGEAIAENLMEMMSLRTPVLSLFIGEGGSGGALALAVADEIWMLSNAYYSVVSPESCANILWKDPEKAGEAASALKLSASDLRGFEVIERVIREPDGYSDGMAALKFYDRLLKEIRDRFRALLAVDGDKLLEHRYERFRKIGRVE